MKTYNAEVRQLYEALPFPARDPEDEKKRLMISSPDLLARVNHYCFRGRQRFGPGFRALVAGGGTGDAAIFLAEQLRDRGGEVTYLDMSAASMAIAKKRAAVRGLANIRWVNASILEIPKIGLPNFDYINCLGVLHHLDDPLAGLRCLEGVLGKSGAIALMLYGRLGRAGVTVVQDLLRMILAEEVDLNPRVATAISLLKSLPGTNPYMKGRNRDFVLKAFIEDPTDLADTFLHPCDHSYNVEEFHCMAEQCDLHVAAFTTFDGNVTRLQYDPLLMAQEPALKERLARLPVRKQQLVAEMMDGSLHLHTAYLVRDEGGLVADFDDESSVPFAPDSYAVEVISLLLQAGTYGLDVELFNGNVLHLRPAPPAQAFLRAMDGRRTIAELRATIGADASAWEAIRKELAFLNGLDWILLRHQSIDPYPVLGVRRTVDPARLQSKPWRIKFAP